MHQVIDAQSIEAKLDFTVKRDGIGSVLIRWCPEMKYCDLSTSPAGMMGMFPPGSNYQGMLVYPVMSAQEFLIQVVFPWAHPEASQTGNALRCGPGFQTARPPKSWSADRSPAPFASQPNMMR
jgi:hypothetical protein